MNKVIMSIRRQSPARNSRDENITEVKNSLEIFKCRAQWGNRMSCLEERTMKITESKEQKENKEKEQILRDPLNAVKGIIHIQCRLNAVKGIIQAQCRSYRKGREVGT